MKHTQHYINKCVYWAYIISHVLYDPYTSELSMTLYSYFLIILYPRFTILPLNINLWCAYWFILTYELNQSCDRFCESTKFANGVRP